MRPLIGSAHCVHWAPVRTDVGVQWVRAEVGSGRVLGVALMGGADLLE